VRVTTPPAPDAPAFEGVDALEPQRGAAALIVGLPGLSAFPIEPRQPDHQPLLGGPPADVPDANNGILQMGRHDLEIIGVERDELEELHPFSPRKEVIVET
jgi:hypothetical protein